VDPPRHNLLLVSKGKTSPNEQQGTSCLSASGAEIDLAELNGSTDGADTRALLMSRDVKSVSTDLPSLRSNSMSFHDSNNIIEIVSTSFSIIVVMDKLSS